RDTKQIQNSLVSIPDAPYILVDRLFSFPSFEKTPILTFYNNLISSDGVASGIAMGTANVIGCEYVSGTIGSDSFPYPVYKLYVKNISFPPGPSSNPANAGSIFVQNALIGTVSCTANMVLAMNVRNTVGPINTGDILTLNSVSHRVITYDANKSQILVEPTS